MGMQLKHEFTLSSPASMTHAVLHCRCNKCNDSNFLPATGTLHYLKPPQQTDRVRVDTGVIQGDEVSIFYDPMISKLITWGPTRSDALRTLSAALQDYHIVGVPNNIEFVHTVANHPKFAEGGVDTSFLEVCCGHLFFLLHP